MCMGPPANDMLHQPRPRVYPHVYGATVSPRLLFYAIEGLSPCVWGHLSIQFRNELFPGSIPMCMGPPPLAIPPHCKNRDYPHVYGATHSTHDATSASLAPTTCV